MIHFDALPYTALSRDQLYEVLRLRSEVFVVEQAEIYQDLDQRDAEAYHLIGSDATGRIVAYARLFPPHTLYDEASIGRVLVVEDARGKGTGRQLMNEALLLVSNLWGNPAIRITAQTYLEEFYHSLGFRSVSEPFILEGRSHLYMLR